MYEVRVMYISYLDTPKIRESIRDSVTEDVRFKLKDRRSNNTNYSFKLYNSHAGIAYEFLFTILTVIVV